MHFFIAKEAVVESILHLCTFIVIKKKDGNNLLRIVSNKHAKMVDKNGLFS